MSCKPNELPFDNEELSSFLKRLRDHAANLTPNSASDLRQDAFLRILRTGGGRSELTRNADALWGMLPAAVTTAHLDQIKYRTAKREPHVGKTLIIPNSFPMRHLRRIASLAKSYGAG